jgi:hypothetical protein
VTSAAEEEQGSGILAATSGQPHQAVLHYSRALRICPNAAVLYLRRCAHLQPVSSGILRRLRKDMQTCYEASALCGNVPCFARLPRSMGSVDNGTC